MFKFCHTSYGQKFKLEKPVELKSILSTSYLQTSSTESAHLPKSIASSAYLQNPTPSSPPSLLITYLTLHQQQTPLNSHCQIQIGRLITSPLPSIKPSLTVAWRSVWELQEQRSRTWDNCGLIWKWNLSNRFCIDESHDGQVFWSCCRLKEVIGRNWECKHTSKIIPKKKKKSSPKLKTVMNLQKIKK